MQCGFARLLPATRPGIEVRIEYYSAARDLALREALEPPKESKLVKGKPPEKKLNLAQKEERAQKAVVAVVRAAEFMLTLTNISAKDVPDADATASASDE